MFFFCFFFFKKTYLKPFLFFLEIQSFETTVAVFDDETAYLTGPQNNNPLSDQDLRRRRRLLHGLGNQIARFIEKVRQEDLKIRNTISKANPITVD